MKTIEFTHDADTQDTNKQQSFFRKYFLEGQALENPQQNHAKVTNSFFERHRKYLGFLIPTILMETIWFTLAIQYNLFNRFQKFYQLPLTMIFGATVAGMTSEGGGAVAFPVMTLLLKLDPKQARDYALMIQSVGMTCATFTIAWMGITVEWYSIVYCTIGAFIGVIFGLETIDDLLTGAEKKVLFVAIWASFAIALYQLNNENNRRAHSRIFDMNVSKAFVLILTGFVGGMCTAFAGSGVDICSFSILTLLFRVSEKTATPTSIVLMAINSCVGFFWRCIVLNAIEPIVWMHFSTSVPVVVIFAPFGSFLASHFHRLVLASFIYVLETLSLIGVLATGPELYLIVMGATIILFSLIFFAILSRIGKWLDTKHTEAPVES